MWAEQGTSMEATNPGSLDRLRNLNSMALPEQGLGFLQVIGPCEETQQALVQQPGGTIVLSATLLQQGSECDPEWVPRLWASGLSDPKPVPQDGLCVPPPYPL